MKVILLCLMAISHTLAAPMEYYYEVPAEYGVPHDEYGVPHQEYGVPVESTTHYCPEEDFQREFIPSPPQIQSFPLPELPVQKAIYPAKVIVKESPYPARQEVTTTTLPPIPHEEYGVPHEEYGVPHEEYGVPAPVPHEEYGVPNEETSTAHAELDTYVVKHEPVQKVHKLHHLKTKVKHYLKPKIVIYKKKIEFPFLKQLFQHKKHHQH